jgi:hypothetical protein
MRGAIHLLSQFAFIEWYSVKNSTGTLYVYLYHPKYRVQLNSAIKLIQNCPVWSWIARTLESWLRIPHETWMYTRFLLYCVVLCR